MPIDTPGSAAQAGEAQSDPPPRHTSGPGAYFAALPSVTPLLAVFAAVLLAVGVTTDVLPLVARTAPLALGLGIAVPVFVLLLAPVFGPLEAAEPQNEMEVRRRFLGRVRRSLSPSSDSGVRFWRGVTGWVVATSVASVVLVGAWNAHQATAPSVTLGLGTSAGGRTPINATVRAHRLQSDEVVSIAVVTRPGTAARCVGPDLSGPVPVPRLDARDELLLHVRQGADAVGDVDYAVTGSVSSDRGLVCMWAMTPRRCAWGWNSFTCRLLGYDGRMSVVRRALERASP